MKYLILICAERLLEDMPAEEAGKHLREMYEFTDRIRKNGQYVGANRLKPPDTAATVRIRDGKTLVTDGPYAETTELLGGFYVVDVNDRQEAIDIAAGIPTARFGCIEVRPIADDRPTRESGF